MDAKVKNQTNFKEIFNLISTIISWTLFVLLAIVACFLLYYFIASQLYSAKGKKYEPLFSLYSIMSPSMTPNIKVYDVIVDVRVDNPEDIKVGDVITFISNVNETKGMTITHRVVSVIKDKDGHYRYQTKGDNAPAEDSGSVGYENILGKVALKIPQLGKVQLLFSNAIGGVLILLCVSLFIILKGLVKRLLAHYPQIGQLKLFTKFQKPLSLPYHPRKEITKPLEEKRKNISINSANINANINNNISSNNNNNNDNNNLNQKVVENVASIKIDDPEDEIIDLPELKK